MGSDLIKSTSTVASRQSTVGSPESQVLRSRANGWLKNNVEELRVARLRSAPARSRQISLECCERRRTGRGAPATRRGDEMNRKVTVVGGAGNVGATVARSIAEKELADVVIVDIADQKAAGVALDILQTCPIIGSDSLVIGGSDYAHSANSDIVVITSGVPRKPGMSRDDLLNVNFNIMKAVTEQVVKYSSELHHRARCQSSRRDVPGRLQAQWIPARARHRHGGRARLGTHADLHRAGVQSFGRERSRVRAGRTRRHDGAASTPVDGRRHSYHPAAVQGSHRCDQQAHR